MFYTKLKDRKLYFDGISSYDPDKILSLQRKYKINWVDRLTPTIEEYNKLESDSNRQIKVKSKCNKWKLDWTIPDEYKCLDVVQYVTNKHIALTEGIYTKTEIEQRDIRLCEELILYKKLGLNDILQTIIYIINTLNNNNIVYGVGRGSSVSSYVLYVIGAHDIDSFKYELDIHDFLSEEGD